jgi:hypothetical protein
VSEDPTQPEGQASSVGAIRLTFRYAGEVVQLVSRRRIKTLVPPTDPVEAFEGRQGLWAELRSPDGATVHRQLLGDVLRGDVEVFSDEPERSIRRITLERPAGVFDVLVPDLEMAEHLALVRSSPASAGQHATAEELVRLPLRGDEEGKGR